MAHSSHVSFLDCTSPADLLTADRAFLPCPQVRSRDGLAYSVSGGWVSTPVDYPGLFVASGETADAAKFLTTVRAVLHDATVSAPTEEEVARAKATTLNSFVFNFSSSAAQLQRIISYDLLGVPQVVWGGQDVACVWVCHARSLGLRMPRTWPS